MSRCEHVRVERARERVGKGEGVRESSVSSVERLRERERVRVLVRKGEGECERCAS